MNPSLNRSAISTHPECSSWRNKGRHDKSCVVAKSRPAKCTIRNANKQWFRTKNLKRQDQLINSSEERVPFLIHDQQKEEETPNAYYPRVPRMICFPKDCPQDDDDDAATAFGSRYKWYSAADEQRAFRLHDVVAAAAAARKPVYCYIKVFDDNPDWFQVSFDDDNDADNSERLFGRAIFEFCSAMLEFDARVWVFELELESSGISCRVGSERILETLEEILESTDDDMALDEIRPRRTSQQDWDICDSDYIEEMDDDYLDYLSIPDFPMCVTELSHEGTR